MPQSPLKYTESIKFNQTNVGNILPGALDGGNETATTNGLHISNLNMNMTENSGPVIQKFHRLITQESFGDPKNKSQTKLTQVMQPQI